jgi:hypothetical protein
MEELSVIEKQQLRVANNADRLKAKLGNSILGRDRFYRYSPQ